MIGFTGKALRGESVLAKDARRQRATPLPGLGRGDGEEADPADGLAVPARGS